MKGPGKFISQKKAHQMLKAYFDYRKELEKNNGVPWDKKKDHYAYCFGLEEMRALIEKADQYNKDNPNNPVEGIRIYNTRTVSPEAPGDDVFLIPYTQDTKNVMPVDNEHDNGGEEITDLSEDEGMALNRPRFCPPYCQE